MNEWMNERTNEWMNEWMNERTNERMNEWMNARTNEWMNEWTNERMNEWMNECVWGACWVMMKIRVWRINIKNHPTVTSSTDKPNGRAWDCTLDCGATPIDKPPTALILTKFQFIPHRKRTKATLQRITGPCCFHRQSPLFVTVEGTTQTQCESRTAVSQCSGEWDVPNAIL